MATITEDYVSFEIAKLLKEKGFDETCYACYEYFSSSITMYSGWPFEYKGEPVYNSKDIIICPTLQMAMKWLREVYKILILVEYDCPVFSSDIYKMDDIDKYGSAKHISPTFANCKNYEQACESAIKYSLENLI